MCEGLEIHRVQLCPRRYGTHNSQHDSYDTGNVDKYGHTYQQSVVCFQVGIPLEMTNSWWRVALVYSIGVVSGSLCFAVTSQGVFLAGASGL